MSPRLIVHIGLRKTGSSALQELLSMNGALLSEHGLDYPARLSRFPAHQELSWALEPKQDYHDADYDADTVYDHFRNLVEENTAKGISTILSSEDLSLLTFNQSSLAEIKTRFAPFSPEIVFFHRDPISYHISNYKHALWKVRETRTFSEYTFNTFALNYADQKFMRQTWAGVFDENCVTCLPYNPRSFEHESILSQFLRAIFRIDIHDTFLDYRSNTSIPVSAVGYVRELNGSDLSDETLQALKHQIRCHTLNCSEDRFLSENLLPAELTVLRGLHGARA